MDIQHSVRAALALILVAGLQGCTVSAPITPAGSEPGLTAQLDTRETTAAVAVVERHLLALAANDIDALVETVTDGRRSVYTDNAQELKRWSGFQTESISEDGRSIQPRELAAQYDGLGFSRVAVFHVIGQLPQSQQDDDALPENFDVIVVQDSRGRWLVHDMGH